MKDGLSAVSQAVASKTLHFGQSRSALAVSVGSILYELCSEEVFGRPAGHDFFRSNGKPNVIQERGLERAIGGCSESALLALGYYTNSNIAGTIFSLSNNLNPLVETVPGGGKVGQRILILGNNLTGTTSVTFNGVPAQFKVENNTFIRATVPTGATTGTVSVVTPSAALNSNPQFVVTK